MNGKKIGGWMFRDGFAAVMNAMQTYSDLFGSSKKFKGLRNETLLFTYEFCFLGNLILSRR